MSKFHHFTPICAKKKKSALQREQLANTPDPIVEKLFFSLTQLHPVLHCHKRINFWPFSSFFFPKKSITERKNRQPHTMLLSFGFFFFFFFLKKCVWNFFFGQNASAPDIWQFSVAVFMFASCASASLVPRTFCFWVYTGMKMSSEEANNFPNVVKQM